jgi:hypothetical protein
MIRNKSNDPIKSSDKEHVQDEINNLLLQIQSKLSSIGVEAKVIVDSDKTVLFQVLRMVDTNILYDFQNVSELYDIRKAYNVALFNEWGKTQVFYVDGRERHSMYHVHKSKRHNNGELCFGGDWFVVCAMLPTGQITNHYHISDWDLFNIPETEKALFEFDGHNTQDVIKRLLEFSR